MYYVRFETGGRESYGIADISVPNGVEDSSENISIAELKGDFYGTPVFSGRSFRLSEVKLLAPCCPSKVVAVGMNYVDHIKELGNRDVPKNPILFVKLPHTVIGPEAAIQTPKGATRVDYEAELAVIMKSCCFKVDACNADKFILGATCLNDVTERDIQKSDAQWMRSKNYETFCPIGPWIVDGIDFNSLDITLRLNGVVKQHSNTSNLLWDIQQLISFISQVFPLYPGDVVTTGTPFGVSPMKSGDTVEIEIEKIGILRNHVV